MEDKAFQRWCEDKDNVDAVNASLWSAYEQSQEKSDDTTKGMGMKDAVLTEGA